jgi:hypothetical protein
VCVLVVGFAVVTPVRMVVLNVAATTANA